MAGGVVYAGVGLVEERLVEYLYYTGNIGDGFVAVLQPVGAMAALAALNALQRESYGWMGTVVSLTALVGLAVATGALTVGAVSASPDLDLVFNVLVLGLLVSTVGIVLLGGLTVATGMLPRWCGVALMVGSPVGVFLTMVPSAAAGEAFMLGKLFQALGRVPWIVVGYAVFRAAGRQVQQPSRVR
jgi:hypothetical protein